MRVVASAHTVIVIYEKDLFDFRHGEPAEHLNTVLRSLEVGGLWNVGVRRSDMVCFRRSPTNTCSVSSSIRRILRARSSPKRVRRRSRLCSASVEAEVRGPWTGSTCACSRECIVNCYFEVNLIQVNSEGGVASSPLNVRQLPGAMSLLLTGRDSVAEIKYVLEFLI